MKPQKFVLYCDKIILGRVSYHKELIPDKPDYSQICGGGMFEIDNDKKSITLYGYSSDFGRFNVEKARNLPFEDERLQEFTRVIIPEVEW